MVKPSWGAKRTCLSCSARFYDLNKNPIVCPKCGHKHDPEQFVKTRRARGGAAAAAAAAALAAKGAAKAKTLVDGVALGGDLPEVEGEEADEDAVEDDADDLDEGGDDLEVAIEKDEE